MANDTIDKITSWATQKYAAAPTAAGTGSGTMSGGGMLASGATPTATSGNTGMLAQPTTSAPQPKTDVASWYRTTLGRDGDAAGIAYWQGAIDKGMKAEDAYSMFQQSAAANKEQVKSTTDWSTANTYKGPTSANSGTVVDDWFRNTMGRDATAPELAQWNAKWTAASSPEAAQAVYKEFVDANRGAIKGEMDLAAASQISQGRVNDGGGLVVTGENGLTRRVIDPNTETVQGQLAKILNADSQVLQQARAEGMRTAADRGLMNSSIAASAGADAVTRAATGIATTDSGYYNKAADYNAAASNELFMYDRDQVNQFKKLEMQLGSEAAARAMQVDLAKMQDATARYSTDVNAATQKASQAQQMTIAQMQDATSRLNAANGNDSSVQQQKLSVANNIIQNMEMSPDRKAAMLEALGFGTSAKRNGAGLIEPGTGMAGAVYVIDSVAPDLNFAPGGAGGSGGMLDSAAP